VNYARVFERAMQVPSYTYARMTRRWRSAPNTGLAEIGCNAKSERGPNKKDLA